MVQRLTPVTHDQCLNTVLESAVVADCDYILDGEMMGWDDTEGVYTPCGSLSGTTLHPHT